MKQYHTCNQNGAKATILLFFVLLSLESCIDRLDIKIPRQDNSQLVVDGLITDEPGPYTVRLSLASSIDGFLEFVKPITAISVTIFDNAGNSEVLRETETGIFQTNVGGIRGVIGREYFVRIKTRDGRVCESIPDRLNPVGDIDSLYYEFETFEPLNDQARYGFQFYMDGRGLVGSDNLVRWRFESIFELDSDPKLKLVSTIGGGPCSRPEPPPCSGWIAGNFDIVKVGDCTCCKCWVTRHKSKPHVGDDQFVADRIAKRVEVGYIPLEYFPFLRGKYRAEVKQMSLSRPAFDYWRIIQAQKDGASSLFQPPKGKALTTIAEKDGTRTALGIFYASAVKLKQYYLGPKDVEVKLRVPMWDCFSDGRIPESCLEAYPFSSNQPPADWK